MIVHIKTKCVSTSSLFCGSRYMSLSFTKGDLPLAAIRNSKYPKLEGKVLYATEPSFKPRTHTHKEDSDSDSDSEIETVSTQVTIPDGTFSPVPNNKFRDVMYVFGQSGCGKSIFTGNYIAEYQYLHTHNPVYIVSRKESDEAFEGLNVQYLSVDKFVAEEEGGRRGRLVATPMVCGDFSNLIEEEFRKKMEVWKKASIAAKGKRMKVPPEPVAPTGCLIVYDDVDSMDAVSKVLMESVQASIKDVLNVGRSKHLSVVITSHLGSDYKRTRGILNETQNIVCFPRGSNPDAIKYVLGKYGNLTKDELEKVMKLPSRWVCVRREYPSAVIYSDGAYLTNLPDIAPKQRRKVRVKAKPID